MKVGFVCTNYNNSVFTRTAIASLYAGTSPDSVSIVVVDNNSAAEDVASLRQVERDYPGVDVVFNPENVGYFEGLNIGIRRLRDRHADVVHVVVGNNDLGFPPDFIEVIERSKDLLDTWAVVAPDIVCPNGWHQNPHVLHPISRVRRFVWELYYQSFPMAMVVKHIARLTKPVTARKETLLNHDLHTTARPIIFGLGACYILGPVFFRNFDWLYAPTFMMEEEFFLAEQLQTIGQTVYFDPRFVVYHHGAATTEQLPSRRLWTISRDAHLVYKRFIAMPADERRLAIARGSRASE